MAVTQETRKIYGLTGEIGRDGLLTPDQYAQLNEIQLSAAEACMEYLNRMQPGEPFPLVAMATGIGKGKIIHHVIENQLREKPDSRILVVAGTKTVLVDQTHAALSNYQAGTYEIPVFEETSYQELEDIESFGMDDEILSEESDIQEELDEEQSVLYKTGKIGQHDANVHVGVIQRVLSSMNADKIDPSMYDLVIVDEVHNVGTEKRKDAIHKFNKIVGFTATPYRSYGDIRTPDEYGFTIISQLPLPEAQGLGFLPPLVGMQIDTSQIIEQIPLNRSGNINYTQLERLLRDNPDLRPFIANKVTEIIGGDNKLKTIMVVNFVWEAQEMAKLLKEKGLSAGIAVNKDAAREIHTDEIPAIDSIERYQLPHEDENSIQVLISPYVAAEGFDAPFTEVLVWASPTDSALRYTQYTGRLARRAEGKRFGLVLDFIYQTSQYNWSYNFGMWMKDHVTQLDNGLLWLGPETSIDEVKELAFIGLIQNLSAHESLASLQAGEMLPLQETDFRVTQPSLLDTFMGHPLKLLTVANDVLKELRVQNPDIVARRLYPPHAINVVTELQVFIDAMLAKGVKLKEKDLLTVQPADAPLNDEYLRSTFIGGPRLNTPLAEATLKEIEESSPELVVRRRNGPRTITVIIDQQRFKDTMVAKGARLKIPDILEVQDGDFPIIYATVCTLFYGGDTKIMEVAEAVVERLKAERPEVIKQRKNGVHTINVVLDEDYFKQAMVEQGFHLTDPDILGVQETDFPLGEMDLERFFEGRGSSLQRLAISIAGELETEDKSLVKTRRRSGKFSRVVTDKARFIEEMEKRGAVKRQGDNSSPQIEETVPVDTFEEENEVRVATEITTPTQASLPRDKTFSVPNLPGGLRGFSDSAREGSILSDSDYDQVDRFIHEHEGNLTVKDALELTGNFASLKGRRKARRFVESNVVQKNNLSEAMFIDLVALLGFPSVTENESTDEQGS